MRATVGKLRNWTMAATAAALLASCTTAPPPPPPAPVVVAPAPLPYRWTQGNAPQAHKDAVALFGPLAMTPGEYKWAASIPETGDTKVVIDLLTQLFYVYRGEQLVGVATISSGKKGRETPLGFWNVMLKQKLGHSRKYENAPMEQVPFSYSLSKLR